VLNSILISHEPNEHDGRDLYPETTGRSNLSLKERVGSYETAILLETLNSSSSVREAARKLGISHTALLRKLSKYQLQNGNKNNRWYKNTPKE